MNNSSPEYDSPTPPTRPDLPAVRPWKQKFTDAAHGVMRGIREERSCRIHLLATIAVAAIAALARVNRLEACVLALCVTGVWSAELVNSAVERLAKVITSQHDPRVGAALDLASGAVLVISGGSAVVGLVILVPKLVRLLPS